MAPHFIEEHIGGRRDEMIHPEPRSPSEEVKLRSPDSQQHRVLPLKWQCHLPLTSKWVLEFKTKAVGVASPAPSLCSYTRAPMLKDSTASPWSGAGAAAGAGSRGQAPRHGSTLRSERSQHERRSWGAFVVRRRGRKGRWGLLAEIPSCWGVPRYSSITPSSCGACTCLLAQGANSSRCKIHFAHLAALAGQLPFRVSLRMNE